MSGLRNPRPSRSRPLALLGVVALLLAACQPGVATMSAGVGSPEVAGQIKVFGAFATAIEEPWDGVIHSALQQEATTGRITYDFTDDIGYAGDMERVLTEIAERDNPANIFGDAFGN
jgi:ABC-type glycerol-3-phosphate transport system substrate-binding protein